MLKKQKKKLVDIGLTLSKTHFKVLLTNKQLSLVLGWVSIQISG